MKEAAAQYHDRPYLVVGDDRYAQERSKAVASEEVRKIKHSLEAVNQFVDSNDQLNNLDLQKKLYT